ncbi:MAG TPA: hypothetical protein VJ890_05805 [Vineibacter sp.]|nr:hypothetical protein [Vineibacter sp.]
MAVGVAASVVACDGTIFKSFDLRSGQSLSIDARQRLVLVGDRQVSRRLDDGSYHRDRVVCTEPSPDALVAKAAAIAASATNAQVAASLGGSISEAAASIGVRTPTIQLLRDGLFRACEAYLNGAIDKEEYHTILFNYDRVMTALIIIEAVAGFKLQPPVTIAAGAVNVDTSAKASVKGPAAGDPSAPGTPEAAGETATKTGTQAGSGQIGTASGGFAGLGQASEAVAKILLRVADLMLADSARYGFCVTPPRRETDAVRNPYFHQVCTSISNIMTERVAAARVANQMKQRCVGNPTMAVCAQLTW